VYFVACRERNCKNLGKTSRILQEILKNPKRQILEKSKETKELLWNSRKEPLVPPNYGKL
jgi:hypothetical protein